MVIANTNVEGRRSPDDATIGDHRHVTARANADPRYVALAAMFAPLATPRRVGHRVQPLDTLLFVFLSTAPNAKSRGQHTSLPHTGGREFARTFKATQQSTDSRSRHIFYRATSRNASNPGCFRGSSTSAEKPELLSVCRPFPARISIGRCHRSQETRRNLENLPIYALSLLRPGSGARWLSTHTSLVRTNVSPRIGISRSCRASSPAPTRTPAPAGCARRPASSSACHSDGRAAAEGTGARQRLTRREPGSLFDRRAERPEIVRRRRAEGPEL